MIQDIYQNELDKGCFQHDMTYGDFKDLPRRAASDKVLRDKAFNIAKDEKWFINLLIKIFLMVLLKVKLCETNN